jgi:hypothetical protein
MARELSGAQWSTQELWDWKTPQVAFWINPESVAFNAPMVQTCRNVHSRGRHTSHCVALTLRRPLADQPTHVDHALLVELGLLGVLVPVARYPQMRAGS